MSDASRSMVDRLPAWLVKLSLFAVSVRVKPVIADRTGVSLTPVMLAVNVCEALAAPSDTDRVKSSDAFDVRPSIAESFGT